MQGVRATADSGVRCDARTDASETRFFEQLYRETAGSVYRFLRLRGVPERELTNLTAEVFLRAWEGLRGLDRDRPALCWLLGIARHVQQNHADRASSRLECHTEAPDLASEVPDAEQQLAAAERRTRLRTCMDRLPRPMQEVVFLRYIDEDPLTWEQVARMTGVSEPTARRRGRAALEDLKHCLEQQAGGTR